jgi:dTDP-4-amino-4,6-dideoxygalactose transaminase
VRTGFDLALQALAFPRGSEILLSAITIPDMARIVEHHGLVPVPVDLDLDEPGLSMQSLRQATSGRSRALVVTHLFGGRMSMAPLIEFARQHGLVVIEDCAQSFDGGGYCGHAEADISMFSFGPIKSATALGGAILHVQSLELHRRICAIEAQYPRQPRRRFLDHYFTDDFLIDVRVGVGLTDDSEDFFSGVGGGVRF